MSSTIQVFVDASIVRGLNTRTLAFEVLENSWILALASDIETRTHIPAGQQRLYYGTKSLDLSRTFAHYGIEHSSSIRLSVGNAARKYSYQWRSFVNGDNGQILPLQCDSPANVTTLCQRIKSAHLCEIEILCNGRHLKENEALCHLGIDDHTANKSPICVLPAFSGSTFEAWRKYWELEPTSGGHNAAMEYVFSKYKAQVRSMEVMKKQNKENFDKLQQFRAESQQQKAALQIANRACNTILSKFEALRRVHSQTAQQLEKLREESLKHSATVASIAEQKSALARQVLNFEGGGLDSLTIDQLDALHERCLRTASAVFAEKERRMLCVVCMERRATIELMPCRHLCLCATCVASLHVKKCPKCRNVFKSYHAPFTE